MSIAAWTAALRIARRDAWRAKGRSVLVVALVGLPIFFLAGAAVVYRTWQLDSAEKLTRTIGAADADVWWSGLTHADQTPNPFEGGWGGVGSPSKRTPTTAQLAARLPGGTRLIAWTRSPTTLAFYTSAGLAEAEFVGLDYADPLARGLVRQESGRAPRTTHEVALTSALAAATGLRVGDTLRATDPKREFAVVGIVSDANSRVVRDVYSLPSAFTVPGQSVFTGSGDASWLVDVPDEVTWDDVKMFNAAGFVVLSRQVYLNPPPASALYSMGDGTEPGAISAHAIATGTLVGGMVLLEVVLLAGPAFAVGARRRRRELALLGAVGGARRDLRRVVLADALVLGAGAGLVAVLAGLAASAAAIPLIARFVDQPPGGFGVPVLELAGLLGISVLTALVAAIVPAHRAARIDVVTALAGLRGTVRSRARGWLLGLVTAGTGVAILLGGFGSPGATAVLLGIALVELGVILCAPALVGLVSRLARWLPLSGRIALRDAGRNRTSAAPAVAAVMATVIGAVAAAIGVTSASAHNRQLYQPILPKHDVYVGLMGHPTDASKVVEAVRNALPSRPVVTVYGAPRACDPAAMSELTTNCRNVFLDSPESGSAPADPRYVGGALPQVIFDDGSNVSSYFGVSEPRAVAALRAGQAVVMDGGALRNRTITLAASTAGPPLDEGPTQQDTKVTLRATVIRDGFPIAEVIVPMSAAAKLGFRPTPVGVLADSSTVLSDRQRQALAAGLARIGHRQVITAESGYHNPRAWLPLALLAVAALIAVLASLIATALANVDGKQDLILLAAIGAAPRTRRVLSMSRALVIAGLGTGIVVLAGILPARAWVESTRADVVIPWSLIAAAVVGIPVLAGLLAGLFTRARLPSEHMT